jgi:hypothetical protein
LNHPDSEGALSLPPVQPALISSMSGCPFKVGPVGFAPTKIHMVVGAPRSYLTSRTSTLVTSCHQDLSLISFNLRRRYQNQTGVEIRAYQFGKLTGIAALDPSLPAVSGTYEALISGLKGAGYSEGNDIFGAPYDFRLAADGLEQVPGPPIPLKC